VSESPLSTHAGPIAVIAGGLFAVAHVGQFVVMDRSDLVRMMLDPAFRLLSAAYAITFPLMVIALVALYWREAQEAGVFGAVAFCIAVTGTVALAGDMWFEGFRLSVDRPGDTGSVQRGSDRKLPGQGVAGHRRVVRAGVGPVRHRLVASPGLSRRVIDCTRGRRLNRVHGRHASLGCSPRASGSGARCLANPARPDSRHRRASRDNATLNHKNHPCGVTSLATQNAERSVGILV
jgi:hypothetical protein